MVLAIATAGVSWGVLQNQYTATVSVYVLTSKDSESSSNTTAYNDLTASQLRQRHRHAGRVGDGEGEDRAVFGHGLPFRLQDLRGVQHHHARDRHLGDGGQGRCGLHCGERTAAVLSTVAQEVMGVESVNVVDQAQVPSSPSGPPRTMYTAVGLPGRHLPGCRRGGGHGHAEHAGPQPPKRRKSCWACR